MHQLKTDSPILNLLGVHDPDLANFLFMRHTSVLNPNSTGFSSAWYGGRWIINIAASDNNVSYKKWQLPWECIVQLSTINISPRTNNTVSSKCATKLANRQDVPVSYKQQLQQWSYCISMWPQQGYCTCYVHFHCMFHEGFLL